MNQMGFDSIEAKAPQDGVLVVNVATDPYDVYIGRGNGVLPPSIWGNPFVIGRDGTRRK